MKLIDLTPVMLAVGRAPFEEHLLSERAVWNVGPEESATVLEEKVRKSFPGSLWTLAHDASCPHGVWFSKSDKLTMRLRINADRKSVVLDVFKVMPW